MKTSSNKLCWGYTFWVNPGGSTSFEFLDHYKSWRVFHREAKRISWSAQRPLDLVARWAHGERRILRSGIRWPNVCTNNMRRIGPYSCLGRENLEIWAMRMQQVSYWVHFEKPFWISLLQQSVAVKTCTYFSWHRETTGDRSHWENLSNQNRVYAGEEELLAHQNIEDFLRDKKCAFPHSSIHGTGVIVHLARIFCIGSMIQD